MVRKGKNKKKDELMKHLDAWRYHSPIGKKPSPASYYVLRRTPRHGGQKSRGTFVRRNYDTGELLGEYRGETDKKGQWIKRSKRVASYALNVIVNASYKYTILSHNPKRSSWPRFINRPNNGESANVAYVVYLYPRHQSRPTDQYRVMIQATRKIMAGEQLLANYKP